MHDSEDAGSPYTYRDRFYKPVDDQAYASSASGGPAGGDNFWAWAGVAWSGDPWIGDPPHETPGWYSVDDSKQSTQAIPSAHAREVAGLQQPTPGVDRSGVSGLFSRGKSFVFEFPATGAIPRWSHGSFPPFLEGKTGTV